MRVAIDEPAKLDHGSPWLLEPEFIDISQGQADPDVVGGREPLAQIVTEPHQLASRPIGGGQWASQQCSPPERRFHAVTSLAGPPAVGFGGGLVLTPRNHRLDRRVAATRSFQAHAAEGVRRKVDHGLEHAADQCRDETVNGPQGAREEQRSRGDPGDREQHCHGRTGQEERPNHDAQESQWIMAKLVLLRRRA